MFSQAEFSNYCRSNGAVKGVLEGAQIPPNLGSLPQIRISGYSDSLAYPDPLPIATQEKSLVDDLEQFV